MSNAINPNRRLNSLPDIARLLGLRSGADRTQITRHFERQMNFAASLEIEQNPVVELEDEIWEVRITRSSPHSKISLRPGGRGAWVNDPQDLPETVRSFFKIRDCRGEMVTTRSWKSWLRVNWAKAGGRQLRSRQGEIQAIAEVRNVARETGLKETTLRVDPLLDEDDGAAKIQLRLPCPARNLLEVMHSLRLAGMGLPA